MLQARDSTQRCGQGTGGGVRRFVYPNTLTIAVTITLTIALTVDLTMMLTMLCPLGDATRWRDAGASHSRK